MAVFNPVLLIEEVQKRPALYKADCAVDREEKLALWKEIGAAMYTDWNTVNKATANDRVLQIQKKWRSIKDTYIKELRTKRSGLKSTKRTYRYFKRLRFLGGYEDPVSDGDESDMSDIVFGGNEQVEHHQQEVVEEQVKQPKRKRQKREPSSDSNPPEEVEMPIFPIELDNSAESDSDKLFFMSFLPELRQLPVHIKMWVRAQVANVMQEAVESHYNNTRPGSSHQNGFSVKRLPND